jgi:hypothetical protein
MSKDSRTHLHLEGSAKDYRPLKHYLWKHISNDLLINEDWYEKYELNQWTYNKVIENEQDFEKSFLSMRFFFERLIKKFEEDSKNENSTADLQSGFKPTTLFDYATSELSQDAFFAWLISRGDNQYIGEKVLHYISYSFISELIKLKYGPKYNNAISAVIVKQQWEHIDIKAEINNKILLIIEDKTFTKQHGGQLKNYLGCANKYAKVNNMVVVPVYLKTGNESKAETKSVRDEGFNVFYRNNILKCLNSNPTENDILNDYISYLKKIDEDTNSFRTNPFNNWSWNAKQGFYMYLENTMKNEDFGWDNVNNPSGGFIGLWWHYKEIAFGRLYLLLNNCELCFKIEIGDKEHRKESRNKCVDELLKYARKKNHKEIEKPLKLGNGENMTIAVVSPENYMGENINLKKDKVDLTYIRGKLSEYQAIVDEIAVILNKES